MLLVKDRLINFKETENGPGFINFRSLGVGEKFDFDDCIGIGLFIKQYWVISSSSNIHGF